MPLYEYACDHCNGVFTRLLPRPEGSLPDCPGCGSQPRRLFSSFAVGGRADPGPSADDAPRSWQGVNRGDRDTVNYWHRQLDKREKLEERYPELKPTRRRVLAHEGHHHDKPLFAPEPSDGCSH
jgi:putative FmdB family regulatory protein